MTCQTKQKLQFELHCGNHNLQYLFEYLRGTEGTEIHVKNKNMLLKKENIDS